MKEKIFAINRDLSTKLESERNVDFIVWGENEFMNLNRDTGLYNQLLDLSKELQTHIVVDTVWEFKGSMYDTVY